nr:MAG TPA: hypothetical protein [Bacteriophage sp.]
MDIIKSTSFHFPFLNAFLNFLPSVLFIYKYA